MSKPSRKNHRPNPGLLQESVQATMQRMSGHFAQTGSFLGDDLVRVIGSPTEAVSATAQPGLPKPPTTNLAWSQLAAVRR